ncbi:hypothetical protein [Pseudoclavibacter sp. AY1H1]|uniref:hypothetical protein n=1 Tax=Pseudoclavibacter sp. AY1H1 TaxID=2080584 RepID=UPI0011B0872F|nr:hypothetical protein [Pseudoclavibacter sp. AY1H1]
METNSRWGSGAPHWTRTGVIVTAVLGVAALIATLSANGDSTRVNGTAGSAEPVAEAKVDGQDLCGPSSETDLPVGWGPERAIFTDTAYPDSLTFNSTYENEGLGDERNWVGIRPAMSSGEQVWYDEMEIEPGAEYFVRAYLSLDGPADQVAKDVVLNFNLPDCTAHRIGVMATLSSDQTFPARIWDGAEFWSRDDFTLTVVPDSAQLESNRHPEGLPLATYELVSGSGLPIASEEATGEFLPGYAESAYVTFRVIANAA